MSSPSPPSPAQIYAEELGSLNLGYPRLYPEPATSGEVRLGDVGYTDPSGNFLRLFNALLPADHAINAEGVPDGFTVLDLGKDATLIYKKDFLPAGPLVSKSMKTVPITEPDAPRETQADATDKTAHKFALTGKRGAILVLGSPATAECLPDNSAVRAYIAKNHASWYAWARQLPSIRIDAKPEDIVLIAGRVVTGSEWVMGTFPQGADGETTYVTIKNDGRLSSSSVEVERGGADGPMVMVRAGQGADAAVDADSEQLDQCLFLSYYQISQPRFRSPIVKLMPNNGGELGKLAGSKPASGGWKSRWLKF